VWLVVASGVGVAIAYLRALKILLTTPAETVRLRRPNAAWLATVLLVLLGLLTVGLGLFPDPLFRIAMRLAGLSLP
jgi:NADH:ubiquinone oxidoreductase subunit 2 (subunit N)